jgi:hypothetical protein
MAANGDEASIILSNIEMCTQSTLLFSFHLPCLLLVPKSGRIWFGIVRKSVVQGRRSRSLVGKRRFGLCFLILTSRELENMLRSPGVGWVRNDSSRTWAF